MKNAVKNLIKSIEKALTTKSALPVEISNAAYITANGDGIKRTCNKRGEPEYNIVVFVAGIVEDVAKREMLYNKDALELAANTGIFAGGYPVPEAYKDYYSIPDEEFTPAGVISFDELKAAAPAVSKDNTRPVLTCIHITPAGVIESCDAFRAYRKKGATLDAAALTEREKENGILIPGIVTAYGFKGVLTLAASKNWLKISDNNGLTIYAAKPANDVYINLDSIYQGRGAYKRINNTIFARIIDKKTFEAVLKTAAKAQSSAAGSDRGIVLRARKGFIDYYIKALDIFGSIEAETDGTPAEYNATFNPKYLYDAIVNQGYNVLEINTEGAAAPLYISETANNENAALLLPIRDSGYYFTRYDEEIRKHETPAAAPKKEAPEKDKFFTVPAALANGMTETEKEALKRINDRQNAAGRFENISEEDIKAEAAKIEAEAAADPAEDTPATGAPEAPAENQEAPAAPGIMPPEIIKAREIYKRFIACNFTPEAYQEATAELVYKRNRAILEPIARKAGGLYVNTLAIIAAIMAAPENLI